MLERQVVAARDGGAELVVVLAHWGYEFEFYPDPHFMVLARRMVAAGADLVLGHGPHVVQPAELCHVNRPDRVPGVGSCSVRSIRGDDDPPRTAAIFYSLGDFGTTLPTVQQKTGLVATVSAEPGAGVTGLGWSAVYSKSLLVNGAKAGQSVLPLAGQLKDADLAAEDRRLEQHLGAGWKRAR